MPDALAGPAPATGETAAAFLQVAAACHRRPAADAAAPLRFGVDLGTATVVLTAVDTAGAPVYWDSLPCAAMQDGVVVNFAGAVEAVRALRRDAEQALGMAVTAAATAHPPGVPAADCRACRFVLEQAGIDCRALTDEVSAAQALLCVRDGAVADVGGGSTGVGVFADGRLVALSDEPGGGRYLDLIVAGALGIPAEEAERRKRADPAAVAGIVRPGLERIGHLIARQIGTHRVAAVHLVGGAVCLPEAGAIVAEIVGRPVRTYPHAELVTPFGIALVR